MLCKIAKRIITDTGPAATGRLVWTLGLKSLAGLLRHKARTRRGENFPPVLFISVTNNCNLNCQGCWVSSDNGVQSMPADQLDRIIRQAKRRGNCFFGILGGEPLMYAPLWDVLSEHRDCYFQVFTNGTLLNDRVARRMRELGNVTPLVSIEGLAETSDTRRGGEEVYARSLEALDHCRRHRLLTGVATSICKSNVAELATARFIKDMIRRGVHYLWYYIYRPVGPRPTPELALSQSQITSLRRFTVEARSWAPILIIDAYWDHKGRAICPAAACASHHVNPWGDVEPCPPIQIAADRLNGDGRDTYDVMAKSKFLKDFRSLACRTTDGCILMERPDLLRQFAMESGARDSSGRGTALAELASTCARPSHCMDGEEIPETHWFYRLAKRCWFFGLGAYG